MLFLYLLASLRKILTINNLRKRGLIIVDWCFLDNKDAEFDNYLFHHCEMDKTISDETFSRTITIWVMAKRVVDLLAWWKGIRGSRCIATIWKMILLCFCGAYGWKEMSVTLTIENISCEELESFYFILYVFGRMFLFWMRKIFMISF